MGHSAPPFDRPEKAPNESSAKVQGVCQILSSLFSNHNNYYAVENETIEYFF
jgi:hypothetical protein